jgi:hypothetical protein
MCQTNPMTSGRGSSVTRARIFRRRRDHFELAPLPVDDAHALRQTAVMEEFQALRDEVRSRLEKQQEITSYAIAFMAAIAVAISFLSHQNFDFRRLAPLYPFASLILAGFTLMASDHDMNIAHIYRYIDTILRPRIAAMLQLSPEKLQVWEWNRERARWQQGGGFKLLLTGPTAAGKYSMTLIPNLALAVFMAVYGITRLGSWLRIEYCVPLLVVAWSAWIAVYISTLYFRMVK